MSRSLKTSYAKTLPSYEMDGTIMDIMERIEHIVTKVVSLKSDKDMVASDAKKITLKITFNTTLQTLIDDAVKTDVIRWQTTARKTFDSYVDGQTVNRTYGERIATTLTDEQKRDQYGTYFATLNADEQKAEIARLTDTSK